MDKVEAAEKILNYSFVNKTLLEEAITKSSSSFQRLEFLGDSVLEVAFANYLYRAYPNLNLIKLAELRSANVSNEKFARVAVNQNLYQFLMKLDHSLCLKIEEFFEAVSKEDDPVPYGGLVKPPKVLADIVESIAGAVYIDVNYNVQRLWEILKGLFEPIYTPDDLWLQHKPAFLKLVRLADKHGNRVDLRCSTDDDNKKIIAKVYLDDILIASGCAKHINTAKLLATEEALKKLSECMHIEKIIDEDSPHVEPEDVKGKTFEICSSEKLQLQKKKRRKKKEKLQLQTGLSSLPTASENSLVNVMTQEEMVVDEDSPHVEPEDVKGKLFEICSTRKLQIQTGSSSMPNASENLLTYEMTTKPMVVDKDSLLMKRTLFEICTKKKWPDPIFSVKEERGPEIVQKYVCSVKIEIPTIEGTLHMKGDAKSKRKQAENSAAHHMISALKSSLMSLVISSLQMPKSLDEKKNTSLFSSGMNFDSVEAVEKMLNYSFVRKNLLKAVLMHGNSPLFQRFISVGEPALLLAFTKHLYLTYPKLEPKELIPLHDANTCNDRYARVAVIKTAIYQIFIRNDPKPDKMIIEFIESMSKDDDSDPDPYRKAPRALTKLVGAVAGAVYVDVNYNIERLWEIFRGFFEPLYIPDDLPLQHKSPFLRLFRLADKHGKQIDFRYSKDDDNKKNIVKVYLDDIFIASGCAEHIYTAKLLAVKEALQKLSECMPIEKTIDDDNLDAEVNNVKQKLVDTCSTKKLQSQTETSSLPTASENPSTYEMTTKQMVVDKDSLHVEPKDMKGKLFEICTKNKWPNPIFSVEKERGQENEKKYVCSVKIEIPTIEGTFHMKGDARSKRKQARNSAASHMISALKSYMMWLVISDLQTPKSLDEKKRKNLQVHESLEENKNLHPTKRRKMR